MYNYTIKTRAYNFRSAADASGTGQKRDPTGSLLNNATYKYHNVLYDTPYSYKYRDYYNKLDNCNSCDVNRKTYGPHLNLDTRAIQKQIQKTVRVQSSEYVMNKSSLNVATGSRDVDPNNAEVNKRNPWNQSSDRFYKSGSTTASIAVVPSHGNSTRGSITRLRPGSLKPGGKGVDIKHNSYDRYLARLKGRKVLKAEASDAATIPNKPVNNNRRKYNIVANCSC